MINQKLTFWTHSFSLTEVLSPWAKAVMEEVGMTVHWCLAAWERVRILRKSSCWDSPEACQPLPPHMRQATGAAWDGRVVARSDTSLQFCMQHCAFLAPFSSVLKLSASSSSMKSDLLQTRTYPAEGAKPLLWQMTQDSQGLGHCLHGASKPLYKFIRCTL